MTPFVWSLVGEDAGETLTHIVTRKEAERRSGRGEFWWGLGTPLGDSVESAAIVNKGTLPALFSALEPKKAQKFKFGMVGIAFAKTARMGRFPTMF